MDEDDVKMWAGIIYVVGMVVTFFPLTAWFYDVLIAPDIGRNIGAMICAAILSICCVWAWPIALIALPLYWIMG